MLSPLVSTAVPQTLAGKVAIVTGSNSGIGLAIAKELSARGASTVINYPFQWLEEEGTKAASNMPAKSISIMADMSIVEGPKTLVDAAIREFGHIDILVNSAGVAVNLPLEEQTLRHWDSLVNLNARGPFLLTKEVLPHLPDRGGRIVNICSIAARNSSPLQTIYAGTKGMMDSFTRCWAKELPPKYGCTVNTVSPGPIKTEGFLAAGEEAMKLFQPVIDATPAGKRVGDPEEVAYAVAFLCEERAAWVNGTHLFVNGGLYVE